MQCSSLKLCTVSTRYTCYSLGKLKVTWLPMCNLQHLLVEWKFRKRELLLYKTLNCSGLQVTKTPLLGWRKVCPDVSAWGWPVSYLLFQRNTTRLILSLPVLFAGPRMFFSNSFVALSIWGRASSMYFGLELWVNYVARGQGELIPFLHHKPFRQKAPLAPGSQRSSQLQIFIGQFWGGDW